MVNKESEMTGISTPTTIAGGESQIHNSILHLRSRLRAIVFGSSDEKEEQKPSPVLENKLDEILGQQLETLVELDKIHSFISDSMEGKVWR